MADTLPVPATDTRLPRAEGPWSDLALHSIGWKAFQDLCSQVCEVVLNRPVEIFREAQDSGQDAVFLLPPTSNNPADVGTVQCKRSSDPAKRLRVTDLSREIAHIMQLVQDGQAHTYVLMTSMSVDAPIAVAIRDKLKALGVRKPHILGKQYLIRAIRSSQRLRALVPQVYGLGDLTTILDQRFVQQTRALLDHWLPKLKLYVPTSAHRGAVSAISKHGIVLLLGNPAAGKSAIGAILSTIASEDMRHTVLSLTSPRDFEAHWNPNDPGRFFWIDDAFGANVVREEYVQDWATAFRKVQAAISHGNKFLLTSRRYIYEAAKLRLGSRNLPVFADGSAVVDVGKLSLEEKVQILYNHIHFGNQTQSWKRSVKPYLQAVAEVDAFLPGIAERLGDPTFTKGLAPSRTELIRFMQEPREHLIDTINALDDRLRAGLVLVYVHQGALLPDAMDEVAAQTVSDLMGVRLPRVRDGLPELMGSFLRVAKSTHGEVWQFVHPTISDALTDILRERPHMMAALLRGATIETILSSFVCEGAGPVHGAPVVPATLDDILIARLGRVPDETSMNTRLFRFLSDRASDAVFGRIVGADPGLLGRLAWVSSEIYVDAKVCAHARALKQSMLDDSLRSKVSERLESAVTEDFDLSFFKDDDILALIPPSRLLTLAINLRVETLPAVPGRVAEAAQEADLDSEPEDHFENFTNGLDIVEGLAGHDASTAELIESAREAVTEAVAELKERKEAEDDSDHSEEWDYMSSLSRRSGAQPMQPTFGQISKRSIFDDVDR
jgi:hypothetical protein